MRSRLALVLVFVAVSVGTAHADPDFMPGSDEWNGARRFVDIARHEIADVSVPTEIDLDQLGHGDALLILGPNRPLPEDDLVSLVRGGGRLVIADDYGTATRLFARFGIRRIEPSASSAPRVRGDDALLVARPFYVHPLTEGVSVLVTNRPILLEHPRLMPLIALEEGGPGVVLTGVVGQGRVIAIGDPSVFTNAMMELEGNRRFAANVVRFATESDPPHRLVIAAGDVRFVGALSDGTSGPIRSRIEDQLQAIGAARMPTFALQVASFILALLALILLSSLREKRKEPAVPWLDATQPHVDRLSEVRAALQSGIELVTNRRLGLGGAASRADKVRALARLGLGRRETRRLLAAIDHSRENSHAAGPEIVETARALELALSRSERTERDVEDER